MRLLLYGAPPQAVQAKLLLGLLAQVARKRAVLDAGGCLSGHHEGRFTNMSALLLSASVIVFLIGLVSEQITGLTYLAVRGERKDR